MGVAIMAYRMAAVSSRHPFEGLLVSLPLLVLAPLRRLWYYLTLFFRGLDRGLVAFALPFGVHVTDPRKRYPLLLGAFTLLYILGALPLGMPSLAALAVGYVGVVAIGRAWVVNEKLRTRIAKKLIDGKPGEMPDLRGTALVAALQLLILFPLLFQQVHRQLGLFAVHGDNPTLWSWFWFAIDKTYLKALPDWSALYNVHITSIEVDSPWGRHLVLFTRLTFDYILLQGILRLLAIRTTIREAVAAVKSDPDLAVRLGKRAIGPLIAKLSDPDKGVRGAAANALMQLGDKRAVAPLVAALQK